MDKTTHISVVTPVYGCVKALPELYERLRDALGTITEDYEIIMVNDASPDEAWSVIEKIAKTDKRVKGINLSRNFGQHNAITAGLDSVQGDWVVVMDCDLQDRPEEIINLYNKAIEGYDAVVGKRNNRQDNSLKKFYSKLFYIVFNYLAGEKIDGNICNFGIYSTRLIENLKKFKEHNKSFGLITKWLGFSRIEVEVKHAKRSSGKSGYSLKKMLSLAINSITAYSNKLLTIIVIFGLILALGSLFWAGILIIKHFIMEKAVPGWTSLMVSIYFLSGVILTSMGIIGIYIGNIFTQVKNRPHYIVDSTTFEIKNDK